MNVDPKTGLVTVIDRGARSADKKTLEPAQLKWAPVDVFPNIRLGGDLKEDGKPRYVLAENYVPPATA